MKKTTKSSFRIRRQVDRPKAATFFCIAALLSLLVALPACNRLFPAGLNALDNWYESDEIKGWSKITLEMLFRNDTAETLTFPDSGSFDLWLNVDGEAKNVRVTVHEEPEGPVAPGENFNYKLTVHMLPYAFKSSKIGFRGHCNEFGDLRPIDMGIVDIQIKS